MTTPLAHLGWLPPESSVDGGPIALRQAGRWWDAIRAGDALGRPAMAALAVLGETKSAVLRDPFEHCHYWLVPTGTAARWTVPYTRTLTITQYVAIPCATLTRPTGPHWVRPPVADAWATNPDNLCSALSAAVEALYGEREMRP